MSRSSQGFAGRALVAAGGTVGASALLALLLLLLPKFTSVTTFGYVQLYLFYVTYLSYLSFGISDGLFVRLSGTPLRDIPATLVSAHMRALFALLLVLVPASLFATQLGSAAQHAEVLSAALIAAGLYLLRSLLTFVHQAGGDTKLFARATVLERIIWVGLSVQLLALGYTELSLYIWADVLARAVGLLFCARAAWPLLSARVSDWRQARRELATSIKVGIFVSGAAIATVLVPAIGRFAAERGFGIEVFAELSLAFSLQSIVMTVVGPIGLVVLPSLKRQPPERLPGIYNEAMSRAMPLLMLSLLLFYPVTIAIQAWLPDYDLLPSFLAVVFPMLVFESRTRLFSIPFLQALRRERYLMAVNLACLTLAALTSYVAVISLRSPTALAVSLVGVVGMRAILLERAVESRMGTYRTGMSALEGLTVTTFILANTRPWTEGWWAIAIGVWSTYLILHRKQLMALLAKRSGGARQP